MKRLLLLFAVVAMGCSDSTSEPDATAVQLSIAPASITLAQGSTQQFTVTASLDNGTTQDVSGKAQYVITGGSITAAGLYTVSGSPGQVILVQASYKGLSASAQVTLPTPKPNITGTWAGTVPSGTGPATITTTIVHDTVTNQIQGAASFVEGSTSIAWTVSGVYAKPAVSLTFTTSGFQPMIFAGNHAGTTIAGTLNGSGFVNSPITFTKR